MDSLREKRIQGCSCNLEIGGLTISCSIGTRPVTDHSKRIDAGLGYTYPVKLRQRRALRDELKKPRCTRGLRLDQMIVCEWKDWLTERVKLPYVCTTIDDYTRAVA